MSAMRSALDTEMLLALERARTQNAREWIYVWIDIDDSIYDSIYYGVGPYPTEEAAFLAAEENLAKWHAERTSEIEGDYRYVVVPLWHE